MVAEWRSEPTEIGLLERVTMARPLRIEYEGAFYHEGHRVSGLHYSQGWSVSLKLIAMADEFFKSFVGVSEGE